MTPYYLIYEITNRCNSDCIYCYNVWKENGDYPKGELSLPEIKILFSKILSEIKPQAITIAGGEPLLHSYIFDVIAYLKQFNMKISIATNGTLLTQTITNKLISSGINHIEISLDSCNEKTYELLTRNNNKNLIDSILTIQKNNIPYSIASIITKKNIEGISDVIDLACAFSAQMISLNPFVPGGTGIKHTEELAINKDDLLKVLDIANNKTKEYDFPIAITIPVEPCWIDHNDFPFLQFGPCICGISKWAIDPLGNLRTCEQNPEIIGNLFSTSFLQLTKSDSLKNFNKKLKTNKCIDCEKISHCGGGCRFSKNT